MDFTSHQLPYPLLTEDADGPTAFRLLAQAVDDQYGDSVATAADLPAAGTFAGQQVWVIATKTMATWNGTSWDNPPGRMASGFATMPALTAGISAAVNITFPVGRFTATPVVVPGYRQLISTTITIRQWTDMEDTAGARIVMRADAAVAAGTLVSWHAIQPDA